MLKNMRLKSTVQYMRTRIYAYAVTIIAVIVLGFSFGAHAQQPLTLQDAIAIALQNNYDIQLAESDSARTSDALRYRLGSAIGCAPDGPGRQTWGGAAPLPVRGRGCGRRGAEGRSWLYAHCALRAAANFI